MIIDVHQLQKRSLTFDGSIALDVSGFNALMKNSVQLSLPCRLYGRQRWQFLSMLGHQYKSGQDELGGVSVEMRLRMDWVTSRNRRQSKFSQCSQGRMWCICY